MPYPITITQTDRKKEKPDSSCLGFGRYFTDHMFVMDYSAEIGWHDPRIVPYAPLALDPAALVLHYGQAIFEGMKAYRTSDDRILLFRPEKNAQRLNLSAARLSMPSIDEELFLEALRTLISLEKDWVPRERGTSLYIRPFMFATEPYLGVRASESYKLVIVLSPVGAYYAGGMKPVKIHVESRYVRAVRGGTGFAKVSGNYAASLKAQEDAHAKGYEQVLWLDAIENKYIEEVGSMNVFFKINGEVWTPPLHGSILGGITRDSVIHLLRDWGIPVREEKLSMEDLYVAYTRGELEEAFGTGTAAVVSPIGVLGWNDHHMVINHEQIGELTAKLYGTLTGIQYGEIADPYGWIVEVE